MNKCGPALVEGQLDTIATLAVEILEKKSLCQQDPDGDDEGAGADAEQSEYESALISNAADVFGAMAAVLGADFGQAFGKVLPLIAAYSEPKHIASDRAMAIGSLGEIIVGLKDGVTPFTESLLQVISRGLQDQEADVRSNSAFAAGVLIQNSSADLAPHFPALLGVLHPFFQITEPTLQPVLNARDNAAGALARMVIKNSAALPVEDVFNAIVSVMPLVADEQENKAVYGAIFELYTSNQDIVLKQADHLLQVFKSDVANERLEALTRASLEQFIEALKKTVPEKVAAAGF
jgi:hypothetical protein